MTKSRIGPTLCLLTVVMLLPTMAQAQTSYLYGVSALFGIGGSSDATPDAGFTNTTYQLGFSLNSEPKGRLGVRLGQLDLDDEGRFGDLFGAELSYLNVGGEYRYRTTYYDSGIYLALGGYRLQGNDYDDGSSVDETSFGAALGLTGEFAINRRWSVLVEIAGHWANFDQAELFATGHIGLGYYF